MTMTQSYSLFNFDTGQDMLNDSHAYYTTDYAISRKYFFTLFRCLVLLLSGVKL